MNMKNIFANFKLMMARTSVRVLVLALAAAPAAALDYPERPIGVMVASGAGGASDLQARIVASVAEQGDYLGREMYVFNRGGDGGRVGWNHFVSKAPKDGYILATYSLPNLIAQAVARPNDTRYRIANLEPLGNWGADPAVLVVGKNSEFNSVQDVVDYAKANAGELTVSGGGEFVGHHIAFLQLAKAAKIKMKYVPHSRGSAGALKDVTRGVVQAGFNNLSDAYRARNKLKILAIADLRRNNFLPDTPTFQELGIDIDDTSVNFRGLMVAKGTPRDVIEFLSERVPQMFSNKEQVATQMEASGSPLRILTRSEVAALWKKQQSTLPPLLRTLRR